MTGLTQQQLAYLNAMGIQAWLPREIVQVEDQTVAQIPASADSHTLMTDQASIPERRDNLTAQTGLKIASVVAGPESLDNVPSQMNHLSWQEVRHDEWPELQARVSQCMACDLHRTRTQTVFGVGNQLADWLIIGEAPGADEDRQGEPFVGRAGQLLNNMLLAIGLRREQVYIANILKCRPPNNRDPRPEEVMQCEHYLRRQVELLQPKIIMAVGRIAAQNLLKTDTPIGRLRGKLHYYECTVKSGSDVVAAKTPVIVTYHPAYLLRSPKEKRKAWQDLQFAVAVSQGTLTA